MALEWIKCEGNQWCNFNNVNLSHSHFIELGGVYIIWHGGQSPWTVYVGQGLIAERLAAHRQEKEILQYSPLGLFVTWAKASVTDRDGIELFLAQKLQPRVGHRYPSVNPIPVNLPW
jgi:hypothetical protein